MRRSALLARTKPSELPSRSETAESKEREIGAKYTAIPAFPGVIIIREVRTESLRGSLTDSITFRSVLGFNMAPCQHLLVIFLGWIYICSGYRFVLDEHPPGLKRKTEIGQFEESRDDDGFVKDEGDLVLQETVSEHMQMLYEKYNSAGFHFRDGNTVRSFKAHWGM